MSTKGQQIAAMLMGMVGAMGMWDEVRRIIDRPEDSKPLDTPGDKTHRDLRTRKEKAIALACVETVRSLDALATLGYLQARLKNEYGISTVERTILRALKPELYAGNVCMVSDIDAPGYILVFRPGYVPEEV